MQIVWKNIIGFENEYQISNTGLVKSRARISECLRKGKLLCLPIKEKLLKPSLNKDDYLTVKLCKDGIATHKTIHRLVAFHFVKNPYNLPVINHKDTNKLNNYFLNLEWCTAEYNTAHAVENKLMIGNGGLKGEQLNHKLKEQDVLEIRTLFDTGKNRKEIAEEFGITDRHVNEIGKRKLWKHLK